MINFLLDECLPKKLKYRIDELNPDFETTTVPEMNWAGMSDKKLLFKAEKEFDVFITSDRNLSFQQSIENISIHVVLLIAVTNTYEDLSSLVKQLELIINTPKDGKFTEVQ